MAHKFKQIIHKLKFSLLDWIIIFSCLIGFFVIGILLFRKDAYKIITVKVGENNILYSYASIGPQKWFSNLFTVGMKEESGFGKLDAEVLHVYSYDSDPTHKNVYLTVKIRTIYNRSSRQYIYKGKAVAIGSTIRMSLGSILTDGLITNIEGVPDLRIKKTVTVETQMFGDTNVYPQTSGVSPYIADSLSVGDEIKDNHGNMKVEILEKRIEDAKQLTTTSDGRMYLTINPLKKDIYLTLEVNGFEQSGNIFVFDDVPILINQTIPLHFQTISLYPIVTQILKIE